jgi:signal transduction histidine kinase/CheY-like chemotaxis protein/HPt (histidine-containing phosphotransfer) domain-containing protein
LAASEPATVAVPAARRPWLDRPGLVLLVGLVVSAVFVGLDAVNAGGRANTFEDLLVLVPPTAVAVAMVMMARREGPKPIPYRTLGFAAALSGIGNVVLDVGPWLGRPVSDVGGNSMFILSAVIALAAIVPVLYRRLDREAREMAALDGGIMVIAGTALVLAAWRTGDGGAGPAELFIPVAAAILFASAGLATVVAVSWRAAPVLRGIWCAIPGTLGVGLALIIWVDLVLQGRTRDTLASLLYSFAILVLGYAWVTWNEDVGGGRAYETVARLLGDWLPSGAILVCVAAEALPHGRMDGIDIVAVGTAAVVLLAIVRQRLLIGRERRASLRLTGEERLRAEKDAAESANRAKSAFLAMMSHEIRTPMNAILGNAGLLLEAQLEPTERESAETIESAGQTLLTVINDVLDFSKIEADRMELESVGFAPATLIGSVVSLFRLNARERGLTLAAEVDPSIPVILAGDPHRLSQVLSNLVGNAIKFTAHGGVAVRARVVDRTTHDTVLRFEVSDTGIGIDEVGRARLFEPFVQVDSSPTRRFEGTGLGLAICKKLVELMGGEIGVDSTPGVGSTFWFTVLLAAPTDVEAGDVLRANEDVVRTADLVGARVLVAEDNLANKRLVERLLARVGVAVTIVSNGAEAVEAIRTGGYDLVLMDCHMPQMDGFEATSAIRADGLAIPIVALTADAMSGDREACLAAGMNDYLSKPVVPAALIATLHRWLPADRGFDHEAAAVFAAGAGPTPPAAGRPGTVVDPGQMAELLALDPDGSAGFLAAMVASYEGTLAETLPGIRAAIAAADPSGLVVAAHKLKGVAGNLGLRGVFESTSRLVALGRSGTTTGSEAIAADLESALDPAAAALRGLLAGDRAPGASGR